MNKSNNNFENNEPNNDENLGNNNYPNNPYVNGDNPYNLGYPNSDLPFLDNDLENNQIPNQNFGTQENNNQLFPDINNPMINNIPNGSNSILPEFDDVDDDVVPGFDNVNDDNNILPGFDDSNNDDMLPGFNNSNSSNDMIPGINPNSGLESSTPSLNDDDVIIPGLNNYNVDPNNNFSDSITGSNNYGSDDMLPGFGNNNADGMLPQIDDNYDDDRMFTNFNNQNSYGYDQNNNSQYEQPADFMGSNYSDSNFSNDNYVDNNFSNNNYVNDDYANNYTNNDYNDQFARNWMGTLYEKAYSKKFNWCAALFGPAYLLFRKMYLTGALTAISMLIVSLLISLLTVKTPALGVVLCIVIVTAYILGFGFSFYPLYKSFVNKKLATLKNATTDNNQLLSIATQKGGTSVLALVLYFVIYPILSGILITILIGAIGISIFNSAMSSISDMNINLDDTNSVFEQTQTQNSLFNFYEDYSISYNSNNWFLDENNKTLTFGNYVLAYKAQYNSSTFNADMSTSDGRATILTLLSNSLQTQAASANMQVEVGNSSFASQNSIFYAYIDIIDTSSISRYYFIIQPDDQLLFQFVLTVADTIIDNSTNVLVLDMLSSLSNQEVTEYTPVPSEVSDDARQVLSYDTNIINETSQIDSSVNAPTQLVTNTVNSTVSNSNLTDMLTNY